jgi:N-acetylglucosaminyldiphosphoundecaprenol N-acetyl-beta-D-mannosaminyltransferase
MLRKNNILGVNITNELEEEILEYLFKRIKNGKDKTFIITPNPEMLVYASKHLDYQDKLNHADIALPDGVGLFFAAGFKGEQLRERITGVDFIENICKESSKNPISMGLLGGKGGVAELTAKRLKKKYPWVNIVFVSEDWDNSSKTSWRKADAKDERKQAITTQQPENIDILFVAFGVPKQEEWIYANLGKIPVKAAMGVGGSFDYISGSVTRAPYIFRLIGFEWLFRLLIQPWRWKRQLALLEFIILVLKQKFSKT